MGNWGGGCWEPFTLCAPSVADSLSDCFLYTQRRCAAVMQRVVFPDLRVCRTMDEAYDGKSRLSLAGRQ